MWMAIAASRIGSRTTQHSCPCLFIFSALLFPSAIGCYVSLLDSANGLIH